MPTSYRSPLADLYNIQWNDEAGRLLYYNYPSGILASQEEMEAIKADRQANYFNKLPQIPAGAQWTPVRVNPNDPRSMPYAWSTNVNGQTMYGIPASYDAEGGNWTNRWPYDSGGSYIPNMAQVSEYYRPSEGFDFGTLPDASIGPVGGFGPTSDRQAMAMFDAPPGFSYRKHPQVQNDSGGFLNDLFSAVGEMQGLKVFGAGAGISNLAGMLSTGAGAGGMGAGYGAVEPTVSAATGATSAGMSGMGAGYGAVEPTVSAATGTNTGVLGMDDWLEQLGENWGGNMPTADPQWWDSNNYGEDWNLGGNDPNAPMSRTLWKGLDIPGDWGDELSLLQEGGSLLAKTLFGSAGGDGTGGGAKGGYQFPWEKVIASIMAKRSLDKYRSDLLGVMNKAIDKADPFASERGRYQSQLRDLTTTPSNFLKDPGIADLMNYEGEATGRDLASKGYNMSGNFAKEVAEARNRTAFQNYLPYVDQISKNAGAYFGPSNAGTLASTLGAEGAKAGLNERGYLGNIIGDISRGRQPTSGTGNKNLFDWITESF